MEDRIRMIRKRDNGTLEVQFEGLSQFGKMQLTAVKSYDPPNPRLDEVLQRFKLHVCDLIGVDRQWKDGLEIVGVKIKYGEEVLDENGRVKKEAPQEQVILAEKIIPGLNRLKVITPATRFAKTAAMDLEDLCRLGMAFAHGERAQLPMSFEEPEEDLPMRLPRSRRTAATVGGVH